ncbi:phage Gp37/Gp68 family protein [Rhodobacter sp. NSM]|uniref:phage Gp37/Gp68 family protein n=1 Tax=Rhodobacter sp. NSM TaxID=3457501 RepID=UPI003FCFB10D
MAEKTTIEWCRNEDGSPGSTWNPITGCTLASPGCQFCYAADLAATRLSSHQSRAGLTKRNAAGVAAWTGEVRLNEQWLDSPLRWKRPRRIFVCAHADLFHEAVPDEWIDRVFAVMALAPQHTFQVLTKRAARMREYVTGGAWRRAMDIVCDRAVNEMLGVVLSMPGMMPPPELPGRRVALHHWPLPNVWLGVSAEDQQRADERIPDLLSTPAAVRFGSFEPLLGPLDLTRWMPKPYFYMARCGGCGRIATSEEWGADEDDCWCQHCYSRDIHEIGGLDWTIVGGESGRHARPMHPDWARSLRDQAQTAGVPFLFKQWGEWGAGSVKMSTGEPVFREFTDFQQWVNKASTWVNGGICLDARGRQCRIGADMMRARDEGAFPVTIMHRVGKARSGRLLDGREWNEMPEAAHG